jgi:hypothetical protein
MYTYLIISAGSMSAVNVLKKRKRIIITSDSPRGDNGEDHTPA